MAKVLVTGGMGYIGSHTIVDLINKGFEVISIDNFVNSYPETLDRIEKITRQRVANYNIDLCDKLGVKSVFKQHPDIAGVIHFAALIYVNESVEQPIRYFDNNLNSLLNIMACMNESRVNNLIFSSSCSVYGNATDLPVTEKTPFGQAECPYARTKQIGEQMIVDYCKAYTERNAVILRYFNPAGAHVSGQLGEKPKQENTHLIPVITEVASGHRASMTVFGVDYETRDGSCLRDYIHVMDLADAHSKAFQYLLDEQNSRNCEVFNLGSGQGVTVLEAINAFEKVTGISLNYRIGSKREGDVGAIYADTSKAKSVLNWVTSNDIESIMHTSWDWEQNKNA
ncbi:MAG: UDP-glucose 4-epimerase GalE [Bacteroidota bacterium]